MKKFCLAFLSAIIILALVAGCSPPSATPQNPAQSSSSTPDKVYELKASSGDNEDYPSVLGLYKFAELVKEKSGGRVVIDVYAGGALYGDQREEAEAVINGTLAFSVPQVSVLSTWDPRLDYFSMLYLFSSVEHAIKVLDSDIATELFTPLEDSGIIMLAPFTGGGMRSFYNSKKPIITPEDVKGLKLRTTNSTLINEAVAQLGAIPTPVSWGELYTTLMQKGADGAEHSPTDVLGSNFFEACHYYSLDEHTYELIPLIASKKTMDALPADLQQIIRDCAKEALVYNRDVAAEQSTSALEELIAKGMEVNDNVDKAAFIEAVKPVNEKYAEEFGKDIFDRITEMGK